MQFKMHKKGALELSINAIVIIVIALTLLGLGIVFVRNMMTDIGDISKGTFQKIEEQLNTDLATSDVPLLFSKSQLTLQRGQISLEGFGVRNDEPATIKYGIKLEIVDCPKDPATKICTAQLKEDAVKTFNYIKGDQKYSLAPAERQVNKVQVSMPRSGVTPGLYLIKMSAYRGQWDDTSEVCDETTFAVVNNQDQGCMTFGQTELFLTVA